MDNIVSLEQKVQKKHKAMREKVLKGLDSHELHTYYEKVIKYSVRHLSYLQRYMVEEFLYEVVQELFYFGVISSKPCLVGKEPEEIIREKESKLVEKVRTIYGKHLIYQYVGEWDAEAVMMIAEDIAFNWFEKGVRYGKKQYKLKLL